VTNAAPEVAIHGDAARALNGLLERLQAGAPRDAERGPRWGERLRTEARASGANWDWLLDGIAAALGRDGILTADNTKAAYLGAAARVRRHLPRTFFFPTGYGTLGYALPAAIGAKLARPDVRVIALLGDGGVMFTLPELASAAQLGIPLPVVIVDNAGYGEIRDEMNARGDTPLAVDIAPPDFVAVARGLGCHAVHVEDASALAPALEEACTVDRPTLVHVPGA
jgi:acetolactate synthase-1/2/3 large subunit